MAVLVITDRNGEDFSVVGVESFETVNGEVLAYNASGELRAAASALAWQRVILTKDGGADA